MPVISIDLNDYIKILGNDGKMHTIEFKEGTVFMDGKKNELLENFALLLGLNIKEKVIVCGCCGNVINYQQDCPHCEATYF